MKMGKKRKFNRFIRWIKSDLPNDNKSVLLLGVTKLPSPTPIRSRPHTLHLDHHDLAPKSQTLDNQPRLKPRLFRSHSGDSLNELLTAKIVTLEKHCQVQIPKAQNAQKPTIANNRNIVVKKVQFDTEQNANSCLNSTCFNNKSDESFKKLGYCVEQPYDYYHPNKSRTHEVTPDFMMDKSVDSIGSCSLDVDASSTDFSDSSVGSSDCTLRSLGIPTPTVQPSAIPSFRLKTENFDILEAKKPSYLNLACTVNGYSNITNYDSKLRENFRIPRSREVSPIRPQDYHATQHQNPSNIKSTFLSPPPPTSTNFTKTMLNSPSKMSESKSQTILRNSTTSNYSSCYTSKKIIYSSSSDTVDQASFNPNNPNINMKFTSSNTSKTSKISFASTINGKSETYEYINGSSQNGDKSKSFIQQRVERLYGPGALAQGFFNSKRTKNRISESSENGDLNGSFTSSFTNGSFTNTSQTVAPQPKSPKSLECEANLKQSTSSPQLPVLRHLRPEFRAQLPISPKRAPSETSMQKSTTVPLSLATITSNGTEAKLNGSIIENKENIDKQILKNDTIKPVKLTDIITEEIPAAPQVVLPVSVSNGSIKLNGATNGIKEEIKDGHYFLKILKNEQDRLICLAVIAEKELEENITKMTDEQLGYLRSASGKARLLVNQKMQQFEGLCHKNINKIEGEQFPTTTEDLQGFWDMVMLQVVQIDELFAELDRIRANNWIIEEKPKPEVSESSKTTKKIVVKKAVSAKAEAERKQREAARKKMIEDRRKAMRAKQQQQQQPEEQSIEIFVPESS